MTRKEAITNLNMISVAFVEPVTKGQRELIDDTINMAIKALEQLTSYEQTINKLTEAISEQEPKTGHWIGHREHCENLGVMPSGLGAYEWCSNCDCGIDVREWHRNHYNYCPNCGAKMESEEKEQ